MNDAGGTNLLDDLAIALQAMVRRSETQMPRASPSPTLVRRAESALSAYYDLQSGEEYVPAVSPIHSGKEV